MPETKTCASCGRRIEWRRTWARDWDDVRWCSAACRRRKVTEQDAELEADLADQLRRHGIVELTRDATEDVRRAARRLAAAGGAEFVQAGRSVDPSTAKGAVTLRRTKRP